MTHWGASFSSHRQTSAMRFLLGPSFSYNISFSDVPSQCRFDVMHHGVRGVLHVIEGWKIFVFFCHENAAKARCSDVFTEASRVQSPQAFPIRVATQLLALPIREDRSVIFEERLMPVQESHHWWRKLDHLTSCRLS